LAQQSECKSRVTVRGDDLDCARYGILQAKVGEDSGRLRSCEALVIRISNGQCRGVCYLKLYGAFAASRLSMSDPSVSKLDYDPVKNWTLGFAESTEKN